MVARAGIHVIDPVDVVGLGVALGNLPPRRLHEHLGFVGVAGP